MVHMVMDQRPLGVRDGLFDSLHLLGYFQARFARLDHLDHGAEMAVSAFQPGDQGGMGCMDRRICNKKGLSSPRG